MNYEIRINKIDTSDDSKLKAYVSVTFDGVFQVHGLKIVDGKNGLFVGMPHRTDKEGRYLDIAHPVTKEFQEELSKAILEKYNAAQ